MRWLVVVLVCSVRVALADANHDLVVEYTRIAHDIGDCSVVRDLGDKVKALDEAYYTSTFLADPVMAKCYPPVEPAVEAAQQPPSETPPIQLLSDRDRCIRDRAQLFRDAQAKTDLDERTRLLQLMPDCNAVTQPAGVMLRSGKPPIDGGRVVGQVVLGTVTGAVGVIGGAYAGYGVCSDRSGEFACIGHIVIGAFVGGVAGMSFGVYAVGNAKSTRGSYGTTFLGTLLGAGVGILVGIAVGQGNNEGVGFGAFVATSMAGSLVGFYAGRKWRDEPPRVGSLLRLDRGRVSLGLPLPALVRSETQQRAITAVPLFSGSF